MESSWLGSHSYSCVDVDPKQVQDHPIQRVVLPLTQADGYNLCYLFPNTQAPSTTKDVAAAALLATLLSSLAYVATGNIGLNLSDEGFLWYGVLRTLDGEIPLRDFQSYEPGRYYWCAAWALLLGDGLLALRLSVAIFQSLGLFCGLLAARCINTSPWFLMFTGTMLLLWMFPRYRAFESSIALIATYLGIRLVESPSVRQHFVAGVFVGGAAFFGRNHALYSALAFLALIVFLAVKVPTGALRPKIRSWILGIAVGIAPLMLMVVFVPGFALGYAESLIFFIRQGPNLPLDYPWPWNFGYLHLAWYERLCLAAAFLLPAVVLPLGAALTWSSTAIQVRQRAVVIAGTAVGIFFGHHVAVRSDAAHLAASIQPLPLTCLALPAVSRHTSRRLVKLCLWGSLGVITTSSGLVIEWYP